MLRSNNKLYPLINSLLEQVNTNITISWLFNQILQLKSLKKNMMKESKTQKIKFRPQGKAIYFFNTFIYHDQVYYISQCDKKFLYVGVIEKNFKITTQVALPQKIKCFSLLKDSKTICVGSCSGNLYYLDMETQVGEQKVQVNKIQGKSNKAIIGILGYVDKNAGSVIISINSEGKFNKYVYGKYIHSAVFSEKIKFFKSNKLPNGMDDIWCAIITNQSKFPYIFDMNLIQNFFTSKQEQTDILEYYQRAQGKLNYQSDQLFSQQPTLLAVSCFRAIIVICFKSYIGIYKVCKIDNHFQAYLDVKFQPFFNPQGIILQLDIINKSILFNSDNGSIWTYDLENRVFCKKRITIKNKLFNKVYWAKDEKAILYGNIEGKDEITYFTLSEKQDKK